MKENIKILDWIIELARTYKNVSPMGVLFNFCHWQSGYNSCFVTFYFIWTKKSSLHFLLNCPLTCPFRCPFNCPVQSHMVTKIEKLKMSSRFGCHFTQLDYSLINLPIFKKSDKTFFFYRY